MPDCPVCFDNLCMLHENEPVQRPLSQAEPAGAAAMAASDATIRIVLVEDNADDALLVGEMLSEAGEQYAVRHARTFAEAMAMIPPVDTPTCVLLDLSLPDADGLEGLEGLRRFAPHAPVVVLTGNDDDNLCFRALATGAQDYVVKGRMTADVLGRSIRYALERKSSEDALFDVGERFRLAFGDSPMGIALLAARPSQDAQVVDANPAFAAMLGLGLDSVLGNALLDYVHEEDLAEFALEMQALMQGRIARSQLRQRLVATAGRVVQCSVTASLLRDPAGEPAWVLAMFEDITVQAGYERELRQALDALDKAAYGVARLDIAGNLVSLNRAYASALGYREDDLVGSPWQVAVHEDDREKVRAAIARASRGGPQRAEVRGQRRDGSTFDADIELVACRDVEERLVGLHYFLRDVTHRTETERALRASEEQYRQIVETANEGVWIMDGEGRTTFVNTKMCEMLGADQRDLLGDGVLEMAISEDRNALLTVLRPPAGGTPRPVDVRFRRADGEEVWAMVATSPFSQPGPGERATLAMVSDITDRKRAEVELAHRAVHDALTQLPNRTLFIDRLRVALLQARRHHTTVGVFFVDLDRFKNINDTLGHDAGDTLLMDVVPRLRGALRSSDTLARFGGDEFVVVCPELSDEREAVSIVERLLGALAMPVRIGAGEMTVTASVGISFSRGQELQAEDMIRDADTAMYRAKRRGGGCYEIFDSGMRAELVEQLRIEREIKDGLRLGQFHLLYQPILDLDGQALTGCEALIRWNHPERGPVAPLEFIPIAERTGLIAQLGDWVLQEACRQLARWTRAEPSLNAVAMSINVSARQLDDPRFPERVREVVASSGIDPTRLRFELTETGILDLDGQTASAVLAELADLGIQLVLDDFGTGYFSLNHLRRLPIAGLKLDGSFASQMRVDRAVPPIVEAVVAMAQSLGLWLVAEGIETREQLDAVAAYGCDMAQGFLLGRPMRPAALASWATLHPPKLPSRSRSRPEDTWVGLKEAAEHLGVSVSTVRRWADTGHLISERTRGGHRRLLVADVSRQARRRRGNVRLNRAAPPTTPLPAVGTMLAEGGERLLRLAARHTYQARAWGWFASETARDAQHRWTRALADACRDGEYPPALDETSAFFRHAALSGATALECHLFFTAFRAALLREVRANAGEAELVATRRLALAIEHVVVGLS